MKYLLILLLFLATIADAQTSLYTQTITVTNSGGTVPIAPTSLQDIYHFKMNGGSITLANNYSYQLSSLPARGTIWQAMVDSGVHLNGHTFQIFGQLLTASQINSGQAWHYLFWIDQNGTQQVVLQPTNFLQAINYSLLSTDSLILTSDRTIGSTGQVIGRDTTTGLVAQIAYKTICDSLAPCLDGVFWSLSGNSGTNSATNFVGTKDAQNLSFRIYNVPSGFIDSSVAQTALGERALYSTSGHDNTAFGNHSLMHSTSGNSNTGVGSASLLANTTGSDNTGIGGSALATATTGSWNTGIGTSAADDITTGSNNTAVGGQSLLTTTSGSNNIAIGYQADVASASTSYAIALGVSAISASNTLTLGPNIKEIFMNGHATAKNNVLTDTSGLGDFSSQVLPFYQQTYFTSVTGDSITPITQNNVENPAGTLTNLTIRLPGNPIGGQILELSSTQTLTNVLWSTALNQANSVESHVPVTLAAGGTIKIQFVTPMLKWVNW